MKVSRRDLFMGGAGLTAGLLFTPVPWKLLGDISIWTQNWPWIPQPARGPVEMKQSCCTLCPSGCGIRVRMAAGWPVGVSGVSTDPRTKGALCPLAFAAHQLNWHPHRLRAVRHRGRVSSWSEAQAALERACSEGRVAFLDGRPGRAASSVLETFAANHNGRYRLALGPETQALAPYSEWSGVPATALGYDLENVKTIVSFGVPLLDGWGTPGRFTRLWSAKAAGQTNPELRLIQIEPTLSHTAARARRWIAIREGSQAELAAGLAHVLLDEHLVAAKGPLPLAPLEEAAAQTGLSTEVIRELARTIVEQQPTLVITPDSNPAVAALNVLLSAVGARGGIVVRKKGPPAPVALESDTSPYRAIVIDSTVPWDFVPRTDAEVFRFAAWEGGIEPDWLLPSPGFLEELTDIPTAPTAAVESYAVAANLTAQPEETKTLAQMLANIDATLPDVETLIHARCEQLFQAKEGSIFAQQVTPVVKFESAPKLEEQLRAGGIWVGDPPRISSFKCSLKEWPTANADSRPDYWTSSWALPVFPSLATKLYQESKLREAPAGRVA
jgi:Molybdopterin oxidoreductase/Molybdopterin oxidoreductase Fe4S4 domain